MQIEIELKPCPFCGGKAYVYPTEIGWAAQCEECWSAGADKETAQKAIEAWNHRAEPENRVLTLEELEEHCKGGADAAPVWIEFAFNANLGRWILICVPDQVCTSLTLMHYMRSNHWNEQYGAIWRCWLRKPTEQETAGTPWEGENGR